MGLFRRVAKPTPLTEEVLNFQWKELPTAIDANLELVVRNDSSPFSIKEFSSGFFGRQSYDSRLQLQHIGNFLISHGYLQLFFETHAQLYTRITAETQKTDLEVTKEILGILTESSNLIRAYGCDDDLIFRMDGPEKLIKAVPDQTAAPWKKAYEAPDILRTELGTTCKETEQEIKQFMENFVHAFFIEQVRNGPRKIQPFLTIGFYVEFHDEMLEKVNLGYLFELHKNRDPTTSPPFLVPPRSPYQDAVLAHQYQRPELLEAPAK